MVDASALAAVRAHALPLGQGSAAQCTPLMQALGAARFALLGEASHGTHEFYQERADITRRLITEHGLSAIAVEADWPDALRVHRYVTGQSGDATAESALSGFERFPQWMWRNIVVRDFVEWLRTHNAALPPLERVGFYGIDLYSLFTSMRAVLTYLDQSDPQAAARARGRYACFDRFAGNTQAYGYAAAFGMDASCENAVVAQLLELTRAAAGRQGPDGDPDAHFHAEQNARLVRGAEQYYRTMFRGHVASWNVRDRHMVDTLRVLDAHLTATRGQPPRIAVWAHNSHLGDASATETVDGGEWNVGQLMREHHGDDVFLLGFSTFAGTVSAASAWDGEVERKKVRPGLPGSCEALFHEAGPARFALMLRGNPVLGGALRQPMLQRAIGVIYAPETERQSHYFHTRLPQQFDAMVHIDQTSAVEPLAERTHGAAVEPPETYPFGT